jgi:uncharacterized membrane protein YedE/YeeE
MFGAGMVVAGGCASGTLMRIGEGFKLQIIALIGFVVGTTLAASHFEFWDLHLIQKSTSVYLPHLFGLIPSVILQLLVLYALFKWAKHYEKKRQSKSWKGI